MVRAQATADFRGSSKRKIYQAIHDGAIALGATCSSKTCRHNSHHISSIRKASPDDTAHPGWPAGTPDGAGGEFRPKGQGDFLSLDQIPADAKQHPVQLTDDSGKPILDDKGKPILRPAHLDPAAFVRQGLAMREKLEGEKLLSLNGNYMPFPTLLPDLMRFKQGGDWDAQRIDGKNVREYQDYATIAIGLYAAAANVPIDDISVRPEQLRACVLSFRPKGDDGQCLYASA